MSERLKELRRYLVKMESHFAEQASVYMRQGLEDVAGQEERLRLFCAHLIEKIDE